MPLILFNTRSKYCCFCSYNATSLSWNRIKVSDLSVVYLSRRKQCSRLIQVDILYNTENRLWMCQKYCLHI